MKSPARKLNSKKRRRKNTKKRHLYLSGAINFQMSFIHSIRGQYLFAPSIYLYLIRENIFEFSTFIFRHDHLRSTLQFLLGGTYDSYLS